MTTRYFPSNRFAYAMGYKSQSAAHDAFDSMCAEGEMSPCEGRVEPYTVRTDGKEVRRYAITVEA